jgi:hypothetical protein
MIHGSLCCRLIRRKDRQLVLGSFYQNYSHYQKKLYRGCEFLTGTEVKPTEIGKRGIAKGYSQIENPSIDPTNK